MNEFLNMYKKGGAAYERLAFDYLVGDLLIKEKRGSEKAKEITALDMESKSPMDFVPAMIYTFLYITGDRKEEISGKKFKDNVPVILCFSSTSSSVTGLNFNLIPNDARAAILDIVVKLTKTPMFKDNGYVGKMIKGSDSDDGTGTGRLGIDIFVLDPSYTGPRHTILTYRQYVLYAQARAHRAIRKPLDTSKPKFLAVPVVKFFEFIGRRRKLYRIVEDYWDLSLDLKSKGKRLYSPCNIPDELRQEYDPRWFDDTVYLNLGGTEYPAPAGYKELLTTMFGDYMQLPPEDKRFPEHFYLTDFHK